MMRKFVLVNNVHVFFILLLVSPGESDRNINLPQQHRPQHLDEHINEHQEDHHFPSSASPKGPRLIGLDVNGRVKSLLWSNPRALVESTLTPLFSSSREYGDEEVEGGYTQTANTFDNNNDRVKERGIASLLFPGAIYGTADYRFRKERWYGLERIGMIFRWNMLRPCSQRNGKGDGDEKEGISRTKTGYFWSPTTLDIAAYRSLPTPSEANYEGSTSIVDSGNIRIGWQQNDINAIGLSDVNPWIQVGFEPKYTPPDGHSLEVNRSKRTNNPFHLVFFLPLIRRRFDLQWTSRWGQLFTDSSSERNQWSLKHRRSNGDPWWIPQVSLDPSMGTLSSKNRYRNTFIGKDDRRYFADFKLRIRTTMPTILSSVTNNAMVAPDDDDDLQTASLRLECSFTEDPGERRRQSLGSTCTTARFETIIIPSFWLRSVRETAKFGLIREHNYSTRT